MNSLPANIGHSTFSVTVTVKMLRFAQHDRYRTVVMLSEAKHLDLWWCGLPHGDSVHPGKLEFVGRMDNG